MATRYGPASTAGAASSSGSMRQHCLGPRTSPTRSGTGCFRAGESPDGFTCSFSSATTTRGHAAEPSRPSSGCGRAARSCQTGNCLHPRLHLRHRHRLSRPDSRSPAPAGRWNLSPLHLQARLLQACLAPGSLPGRRTRHCLHHHLPPHRNPRKIPVLRGGRDAMWFVVRFAAFGRVVDSDGLA